MLADAPPGVAGSGFIDTTGLEPGHYVLILRPVSATALRADVDLGTDLIGNFAVKANPVSGTDRIEFEIGK